MSTMKMYSLCTYLERPRDIPGVVADVFTMVPKEILAPLVSSVTAFGFGSHHTASRELRTKSRLFPVVAAVRQLVT